MKEDQRVSLPFTFNILIDSMSIESATKIMKMLDDDYKIKDIL